MAEYYDELLKLCGFEDDEINQENGQSNRKEQGTETILHFRILPAQSDFSVLEGLLGLLQYRSEDGTCGSKVIAMQT